MHRSTTPAPPPDDHAAELLELGDAFLELDRDFRIIRVNRRQELLSTRPRAETLGRTFWEVWPDTATPSSPYWREYWRCMTERVPVEFEAHYAPLDLWTGVTAYPVTGGGIAIFFRDVSPQKRAEASLAASEQRLRAIFEGAAVGLVEVDAEDRFVAVNGRFCEMLGYTREELLGRRPHDITAPEDLAVTTELNARGHHAGGVERFDYEKRYLRKDGTPLWVHVTVSVVRDGAGRFVRAVGAAEDVTERRRAHETIRGANERLREADRRKDEFLGMLSHELRNPLAPIRNALFILDRTRPEGEQARRAREIISRQVSHLTRLVDDLLDVTRVARGKILLRHEDLDLGALTRRAAEDYRPMMQDRGLDLAVALPPAPVPVNGDPARLTQVLGNLLSNAAKFTPPGGRVTVSLAEEHGRAVLHVRDTGAGIAPELLPSIFEPFTQGTQALARSEGGLGLGLSLVKGLVALHGGEVTVASPAAGGADFAITLPLAPRRAAEPPAPREHAPAARPGGGRRVLVIEDNHDAADSLAEVIELMGHRPVVAHDAYAGLASASEELPEVVLCDIGLPGMDGYEVARQLRALAGGRGVRLVALSGYAQPEDVARAMEAGFDAHVAKPPDPGRLERLLRAAGT